MRALNPKLKRFLALFLSLCLTVFSPMGDITIAYAGNGNGSGSGSGSGSGTATTSTPAAPQVLIAVTTSQSMDGDTNGAIMTGSGTVTSLSGSSSPVNFQIPSGFTPPLNQGSGGYAPYTVTNASGNLVDNSPSRLNMAKAAIAYVVGQYASSVNFALEDYQVGLSSLSVSNTWVYYMSPNSSPFVFGTTNQLTAQQAANGDSYVANPCLNYSQDTANVQSACSSLETYYQNTQGIDISTLPYMLIGTSSDDPTINDVLYIPTKYTSYYPSVFITYSGVYNYAGGGNCGNTQISNIFSYYGLTAYNQGGINACYLSSAPNLGNFDTGPTNAGYVPTSQEVMNVQRGFGYYPSSPQSYTSGNVVVGFASATATPYPNPPSAFTQALQPETNSYSSTEIKAAAVQSPISALFASAASIFNTSSSSCQGKYIILVTDGQPTEDSSGSYWPPLGSDSGQGYGVTATFDPNTGALVSTNDQALKDTIDNIWNLAHPASGSGTPAIQTFVVGLGAAIAQTNTSNLEAKYAQEVLNAMAYAGNPANNSKTGGASNTGNPSNTGNTFYAASSQQALNTAMSSIVQMIYQNSSVAPPVVPGKVSNTSYTYEATTTTNPIAGHLQAYSALNPTTAIWDAGSQMTASTRQNLLLSDNGSGNILAFTSLSAAAFNLTTTASCVPNTSTIISYTIDPNYTYTPNGTSTACSYLNGRQSGWLLGGFSGQDNTPQYLAPPSNPSYLGNTSYTAWAQTQQNRTPMVLFTNNDGFLYAINAQTGALLWGWMPSAFVPYLQQPGNFLNMQMFNGGFTTVDAQDGQGNWATYIVGTAQDGAAYYALKLGSTSSGTSATPVAVAWWQSITGGLSPGESNVIHPAAQAPAIAVINGSAYAVYIVNTTSTSNGQTTSTLYEQNVATGAVTSKALSFQVSGQFFYDSGSSSLYVGDSSSNIWQLAISGSASSDAGTATQLGTSYDGQSPITYVGYTEISGIPYAWAADNASLTVFTVGSNGWQPLWATTNTAGYVWTIPSGGTGSWATSTTVTLLTTGSEVSDALTVTNGALDAPVYAPPASNSCSVGQGTHDEFNLVTGAFPTGQLFDSQGNPITQDISTGQGIAYTASVAPSTSGVFSKTLGWFTGQGTITPPNPISIAGSVADQPIAWRQH